MADPPTMRFLVVQPFKDFHVGQVIEIETGTMEGRTARKLDLSESTEILGGYLHHLCPLQRPNQPKLRVVSILSRSEG